MGHGFEVESGLWRGGVHLGCDLLRHMPAQLVQECVGVVFRQVPELELEAAVFGNDVERRAPANGPRVHGRIGRYEL